MATDRDRPTRADEPADQASVRIGAAATADKICAAAAADKIGAAAAVRAARAEGGPRVVTSESLLGGATQLAILHDRTLYYLRQTRFGKLILTK